MDRFGRKMGRVLALAGASAVLAGAAGAEQALIRIEAKRDAEAAQQAARDWAAKLGAEAPVVVLPLKGGWTGIAIGPMERDAAKARMSALKEDKTIPADSFLSSQNMDQAVPVSDVAGEAGEPGSAVLGDAATQAQAAAGEVAAAPAPDAPAKAPAAESATPDAAEKESPDTEAAPAQPPALSDESSAPQGAPEAAAPAADAATDPEAPAEARAPQDAPDGAASPAPTSGDGAAPDAAADPEARAPQDAPDGATSPAPTPGDDAAPAAIADPGPSEPPASDYIRLEAKRDEAAAQEVLAKWRAEFPEAGLWQLGSGWYAVAIGPMSRESAQSWLDGFKSAGRIPQDAFISPQADLGAPVDAGSAPDTSDLPQPPPPPPVMPDVIEVQRALRWAGHYDGPIDGKAGKGTNDAIAAEMAAEGLADADPAAAMTALVQRRADWRAEAGLSRVEDAPSGLSLDLPEARVEFQRREGPLTIFGPRGGSGAAVILLSRKGNSTDLADLAGLLTALGWVPAPERTVTRDRFTLKGANDAHQSFAEATLANGMIQGFVLIWPAADAQTAQRLAAEMSDSLRRTGPPQGPDLPPTPQTDAADEDRAADGVTSATGN